MTQESLLSYLQDNCIDFQCPLVGSSKFSIDLLKPSKNQPDSPSRIPTSN